MGLWRGKVQSIFMGFYILPRADGKEESTYQEKRYIQKKEKREETKNNGKIITEKHDIPRLGLGGLHHQRKRRIITCESYQKYRKI
jgi:hypothetical protein